jgi:GT2 family glycosyltransferase
MYFEDYDLTVRMAKKYKTIFYPFVQIYHLAGRGAYKSIKLAAIFMASGMYFFSKHGWRLF